MAAFDKLNEIMQSIEDLTNSIFKSIADEQWENIEIIMERRQQSISTLLSLYALETREELTNCFHRIRQCDAEIIQLLTQHADQIKSHLSQLDKTKAYLSV